MIDLPELDELDDSDGPDIAEARQFLLEGDESEWLATRLKTLNSLGMVTRCLNHVRQKFIETLDGSGVHYGGIGQSMNMEIEWNPYEFLMAQFQSVVDLGDSIVLVGHGMTTYATTCRQYLDEVWPVLGFAVLDVVQRAVESSVGRAEGSLKGSKLQISINRDSIYVSASGRAVRLGDIMEIIVWMGTACRASKDTDRLAYCEPQISKQTSHDIAVKVSYLETTLGPIEDADSVATCWHAMFRNAVVADGYPVPMRYNDEVGLELSPAMMAFLAHTPWAVRYQGHFFLKGFNTIMAPTKQQDQSVQWHFLVNKNCERMSHNEGSKYSKFYEQGDLFLQGSRHFVGWSHAVKVVAGG